MKGNKEQKKGIITNNYEVRKEQILGCYVVGIKPRGKLCASREDLTRERKEGCLRNKGTVQSVMKNGENER